MNKKENQRYLKNIKQRLKARHKRAEIKKLNNFKIEFINARNKILDLS